MFRCDRCSGKGKIVKSTCPFCKGSKTSVEEDTFTVDVERGMPNGHNIVFDQEADENPDVIPGDVIFKIKTIPHKRFTREGDHLHLKMNITLLEALVGFTKNIKHLDGHEVKVSRDVVTQHAEVMVIKGEGMPKFNYASEKGDLYVQLSIRMPKEITSEQKEAFKKLLS